MLSASIQCLAMIPTELKSNVVSSIFKGISLYQHIYKLDQLMTPLQVNESNDINPLLISIINTKHFSNANQKATEKVATFCELMKKTLKQIDGVDEKGINSSRRQLLCLKHSDEKVDNNCLLLGSKLIENAYGQIRLEYLKDKRWSDNDRKLRICEDEIEKADKSILPEILDVEVWFLEKKEKIQTDSFSILDFILTIKNSENYQKVLDFGFEFVQKSGNAVQLLKDYCGRIQAVSTSPFQN